MIKKKYSETVINAFLMCQKDTEIHKVTGLALNTIRRYRRDPELQMILNERKQLMVSEAVANMQSFMKEGSDTLIEIIRDPGTPAQTKVNALSLLFTQLRDWMTTTEVMQRISVLEMSGNAQKGLYLPISAGEDDEHENI